MHIEREKLIEMLNGLERNFEKDLPEEIKNYSYVFEITDEQKDIFNYVLGYGEAVLLENNVIIRNRVIEKIDNLKYKVSYEFVKWIKVITNSDGSKNIVYAENEDAPTDTKK